MSTFSQVEKVCWKITRCPGAINNIGNHWVTASSDALAKCGVAQELWGRQLRDCCPIMSPRRCLGAILNVLRPENEPRWDGVTFAATTYYDWWAARCDEFSMNCWEKGNCFDKAWGVWRVLTKLGTSRACKIKISKLPFRAATVLINFAPERRQREQ